MWGQSTSCQVYLEGSPHLQGDFGSLAAHARSLTALQNPLRLMCPNYTEVSISQNLGEIYGQYCIAFSRAKRWVEASPTSHQSERNHGASRPPLLGSSTSGSLLACSLPPVFLLTATGIGTCDSCGISYISTMRLLKKNCEKE